ncbi:MAG: dephospho-CoA kinase [Planctomycetes bacterium]|nr:dephospho-CoA kinase [Planctomycetota bacterium]
MTAPVIGLTGPAGSGKSLVAGHLSSRGFDVFSLDSAGHLILEDPGVKQALVDEFSTAVLRLTDGAVSRKKLASLVFSSAEELHRLNSIVHPVLARRARDWISNARLAGRHAVVEGALVFELDLDTLLDAVIIVDAPFGSRLERLRTSRGWDEARLRAVDAAQTSVDCKASRGALLLHNAGSTRDLLNLVDSLLEEKHWLKKKTLMD